MKLFFAEEVALLMMTSAEETDLARMVFTMLSQRTFRGSDRDFLESIFWDRHCRSGGAITTEELIETVEIARKWAAYGWFEIPMPAFTEAENPVEETALGTIDLDNEVKFVILAIWRDIWEKYRPELVKLGNEFKDFPGSEPLRNRAMVRRPDYHLERAVLFEERFWNEVEAVSKKFKVGQGQAYTYVLDYMKRGRDVIPKVLLAFWDRYEETLPDTIPGAHHPPEVWYEETKLWSRDQIQNMSKPDTPMV